MNVEIVMPNLAAPRAAVFTLSGKSSGGADIRTPVRAQVKTAKILATAFLTIDKIRTGT